MPTAKYQLLPRGGARGHPASTLTFKFEQFIVCLLVQHAGNSRLSKHRHRVCPHISHHLVGKQMLNNHTVQCKSSVVTVVGGREERHEGEIHGTVTQET